MYDDDVYLWRKVWDWVVSVVENFVRLVYFTSMTVITILWFDLYMSMNMFCITVVSES